MLLTQMMINYYKNARPPAFTAIVVSAFLLQLSLENSQLSYFSVIILAKVFANWCEIVRKPPKNGMAPD